MLKVSSDLFKQYFSEFQTHCENIKCDDLKNDAQSFVLYLESIFQVDTCELHYANDVHLAVTADEIHHALYSIVDHAYKEIDAYMRR